MDHKASILIIGSAAPTSLESSYFRAFRDAGVSRIQVFDVDRYRPPAYIPGLARRIQARLQCSMAPHLLRRALGIHLSAARYDLIIVFKGQDLSLAALRELRQMSHGAKWANINPDDPFNPSRGSSNDFIRSCVGEFDWYFIWSRRLVEKLRLHGAKCPVYLPFGYDPLLHHASEHPLDDSLVSFVGTWDRAREKVLGRLARYNLLIHGNGWERIGGRSPLASRIARSPVHGSEFARLVSRSLVSVNLFRPQNLGAHNMRSFEIPAMKGCMLGDRSEGQDEFLPEGQGYLAFSSDDEMVDQVERLLKSPGESMRIRREGHRLIQPHSYTARARTVLDAVGL